MTLYVNKDDGAHEVRVLDYIAQKKNRAWVKQREVKASFDGIIYKEADEECVKDIPEAMLEIRRLSCSKDDYPSAMISYTKLQNWQSLYPVIKIPIFFVVNWNDALGMANIEDIFIHGDMRVSKPSANRRNPYDDREIVFHYPVNKFRFIASEQDAKRLWNGQFVEQTTSGTETTEIKKEQEVSG